MIQILVLLHLVCPVNCKVLEWLQHLQLQNSSAPQSIKTYLTDVFDQGLIITASFLCFNIHFRYVKNSEWAQNT